MILSAIPSKLLHLWKYHTQSESIMKVWVWQRGWRNYGIVTACLTPLSGRELYLVLPSAVTPLLAELRVPSCHSSVQFKPIRTLQTIFCTNIIDNILTQIIFCTTDFRSVISLTPRIDVKKTTFLWFSDLSKESVPLHAEYCFVTRQLMFLVLLVKHTVLQCSACSIVGSQWLFLWQ